MRFPELGRGAERAGELHLQPGHVAERCHPTFAPGSLGPEGPARSPLPVPAPRARSCAARAGEPSQRTGWWLRCAALSGRHRSSASPWGPGSPRVQEAAGIPEGRGAAADPGAESRDDDTGASAAGGAARARFPPRLGPGWRASGLSPAPCSRPGQIWGTEPAGVCHSPLALPAVRRLTPAHPHGRLRRRTLRIARRPLCGAGKSLVATGQPRQGLGETEARSWGPWRGRLGPGLRDRV